MDTNQAKEWHNLAQQKLNDLRGPVLTILDEPVINVRTCDGHAQHTSTIQDLRQALDYTHSQLQNYPAMGEDGQQLEARQDFINVVAIILNAKRDYSHPDREQQR